MRCVSKAKPRPRRGLMLGWANHIKPTSSTQHVQCAAGPGDLLGPISQQMTMQERLSRPQSLFENYEEFCFWAKGQMTRRNEGASPKGAATETQRSQMAFCAKTLRAAAL